MSVSDDADDLSLVVSESRGIACRRSVECIVVKGSFVGSCFHRGGARDCRDVNGFDIQHVVGPTTRSSRASRILMDLG